ncbi:hypothetical protein PHAVU_008G064000 [Phaseolus vulgaris]|uniref:S-protein homolog n=1 Tax=Phaseolus vulgaris TaxID=3885 RepID=V7B1S4_PHAVU|nr:hypothetical protein PHAVU_008G064000g [Phaseolus vulgaris]ESW11852.1 hypothetical protein PHAVU_008G064000g [Phaseolus vulgaris]
MLTLACAERTNVFITNSLEGREDLNLHCKSKDDDLGQHLLHINQSFKMSFRTKIFYGTLFFCSFQWGNGPVLHFDVYDEIRDQHKCDDDVCKWYVHKDGPCRYEPQLDSSDRKCYPWNH